MIAPVLASFERVVLTLARARPVAAAISPAVIALPFRSAARTAVLVAPGAVRARAAAAAELAGFSEVRVVCRVLAPALLTALCPAAPDAGVARSPRALSPALVVSAASARLRLSISSTSSLRRAWMSRRIWSSTRLGGPCVLACGRGRR